MGVQPISKKSQIQKNPNPARGVGSSPLWTVSKISPLFSLDSLVLIAKNANNLHALVIVLIASISFSGDPGLLLRAPTTEEEGPVSSQTRPSCSEHTLASSDAYPAQIVWPTKRKYSSDRLFREDHQNIFCKVCYFQLSKCISPHI